MKTIFLILSAALLISCHKNDEVCNYSVKEITYNTNGAPINASEYSALKPCDRGTSFQEGDEKQMKFYTRK